MKKSISKDKKDNEIIKRAIITRPVFDAEQIQKTIASSVAPYFEQKQMLEDMFKRQAPFIQAVVEQMNEAAKTYKLMIDNLGSSGVFRHMTEMTRERVKMAESLKNIIKKPKIIFPRAEMKILPRQPQREISLELKDQIVDEIVEKLLKRIEEKGNVSRILPSENEAKINLPEGARWENIKIAFVDGHKVEIYYNNKLIDKFDCEKLGFSMNNTKDKRPNQQWELLHKLSFFQIKEDLTRGATMETLMQDMKMIKKQNFHIVKSQLSKHLRKVLVDLEPFEDYKDYGYYKPKFTLLPEPEFRGEGELFLRDRDAFDENMLSETI